MARKEIFMAEMRAHGVNIVMRSLPEKLSTFSSLLNPFRIASSRLLCMVF